MYKVDQEKWNRFSPQLQLQHIAVELARAAQAGLREGNEEKRWTEEAYERALSLVDACLAEPQLKDRMLLYQLRDALAALYAGDRNPAVSRFISSYLLENSKNIT